MFIKLFTSNIPTRDEDLGGNPTRIIGSERRKIANVATLPTKTNAQGVINAAKVAGRAEAEALLLSKLSRHQLQAANSWAKTFGTRVNHAVGMMRVKERVQKDASKLHKNVLGHNLNLGETQANLSGYDAEFQRASSLVQF